MTAYMLFCVFSIGQVNMTTIPAGDAFYLRQDGKRAERLDLCKREFRKPATFAWVGVWE